MSDAVASSPTMAAEGFKGALVLWRRAEWNFESAILEYSIEAVTERIEEQFVLCVKNVLF
jgi:hypothetical protein